MPFNRSSVQHDATELASRCACALLFGAFHAHVLIGAMILAQRDARWAGAILAHILLGRTASWRGAFGCDCYCRGEVQRDPGLRLFRHLVSEVSAPNVKIRTVE